MRHWPRVHPPGQGDFITPGVTAGFVQRFPFGSASVFYQENVGVTGGFGGPTDNKSIIGTVVVAPLKELVVVLNPGWTKALAFDMSWSAAGRSIRPSAASSRAARRWRLRLRP